MVYYGIDVWDSFTFYLRKYSPEIMRKLENAYALYKKSPYNIKTQNLDLTWRAFSRFLKHNNPTLYKKVSSAFVNFCKKYPNLFGHYLPKHL